MEVACSALIENSFGVHAVCLGAGSAGGVICSSYLPSLRAFRDREIAHSLRCCRLPSLAAGLKDDTQSWLQSVCRDVGEGLHAVFSAIWLQEHMGRTARSLLQSVCRDIGEGLHAVFSAVWLQEHMGRTTRSLLQSVYRDIGEGLCAADAAVWMQVGHKRRTTSLLQSGCRDTLEELHAVSAAET